MKTEVQRRIDEYALAKSKLFMAQEEEKRSIAALEELFEENEGKKKLLGVTHSVSMTPRVNVTYERDRGEPHPLQVLSRKFDLLQPMLRIEFRESGGKVRNLVEGYEQGKSLSPEQYELAEALLETRRTSKGKPTINISELEIT